MAHALVTIRTFVCDVCHGTKAIMLPDGSLTSCYHCRGSGSIEEEYVIVQEDDDDHRMPESSKEHLSLE